MNYCTKISISELIGIIQRKEDAGESYCIYGEGDTDSLTLESICYIDSYPEITDDDEEIYPDFITRNNLEFWYREELVQDVIMNCLHMDENVSDETILKAIEYYNCKDSFMDLS